MWCIDELGVAHERIDIPFGRSKEDPAYLAMNPNGLVPAITGQGVTTVTPSEARGL
jgi:glutathione S-transferase